MATFVETRQITFLVDTCCNCGVHYAVTREFEKARREDKQTFYCPNGHPMVYSKSEADTLREKLAEEKRNAEFWRAAERRQEERVEQERRSKAAIKGQLTKAKKRIGNGVCPCCNRTFPNLQAHMATLHPDFKEGIVEDSATGKDGSSN